MRECVTSKIETLLVEKNSGYVGKWNKRWDVNSTSQGPMIKKKHWTTQGPAGSEVIEMRLALLE